MNNWNKIFGSALLIAGTTIGAGMLLPVLSRHRLFYPTVVTERHWSLTSSSALLILEANLWFPPDVNLLSMTKLTLGKAGFIIALILFFLLLYSVNSAYITGSASLLTTLETWMPAHSVLAIRLTLVMGTIIFFGTRSVDYSNRLLMLGLICSYVLLISAIAPHVKVNYLSEVDLAYLPATTIIIVILSFAYQFIIPNIRRYVGNKTRDLVIAILIGAIIPLALYIFWTAVIMGSIPLYGADGLLALREGGQPVAELSKGYTMNYIFSG